MEAAAPGPAVLLLGLVDEQTSYRSSAVAAVPGLLLLPPDVLRLIWDFLPHTFWSPNNSLRHTCKALRDIIHSWASSLKVELCHAVADMPGGPGNRRHLAKPITSTALAHAGAALASFPSTAVLTKLSWVYHPARMCGGSWPEPHALRGFLRQGEARLAALTRLCLFDGPGLCCEDLATITTICPALQDVSLGSIPVSGQAFGPLSNLRSLLRLCLRGLHTCSDTNAAITSLPMLPALTYLEFEHDHRYDDSDEDSTRSRSNTTNSAGSFRRKRSSLALIKVLPWAGKLSQLRSLHLNLKDNGDLQEHLALARHVTGLQHLTNLDVNFALSFAQQPAFASTLVQVKLPVLDTPAIVALAAMPHLTRICVSDLLPDRDLGAIACAWETVEVLLCPTPKHLAWTPLQSVKHLKLPAEVEWELAVADGLDATCAWLHRAAQIVALADRISYPHLAVHLYWDTTPPWPCSTVLEALAPLNEQLSQGVLSLGMGHRDGKWRLDEAHAEQGARHLPGLDCLWLDVSTHGFHTFAKALGQIGWLQVLDVNGEFGMPAVADTAQTLHALALARMANSRSLVIVEEHGWLEEWLRLRINANLKAAGTQGCMVRIARHFASR